MVHMFMRSCLVSNTNIDICSNTVVHTEKVKAVETRLPPEDEIARLVETFKTLGDSTRLKIVLALGHTDLCVCDLAALIGVSVSAISHQLRLLRGMRVVKYRKEGKLAYYSLEDHHIDTLVQVVLAHVQE
jgi:ArsR family transcriptional regulator